LNYLNRETVANEKVANPAKAQFITILINFIISNNTKEEWLPLYIEIAQRYTTPLLIEFDKKDALASIHRVLNSMLLKGTEIQAYYNIFANLSNNYPVNEFAPCKTYALYYAYQLKNYSLVEKILNNFFIYLDSNDYDNFVDFITLNYYKGLVFLSQLVSDNLTLGTL
jgi:hypothetical protein